VLGVSPAQVARALRAADETRRRHAEGASERGAASGGERTATAGPTSAQPQVVGRKPPRDELELLVLVVTYPELSPTPEAARASELLVDPAMRAMLTAARTEVATAGRLDVPAWLEAGPAEVRAAVSRALMDEGFSRAENPPMKLRALCARLELQRVEAEISMTARLLKEASARGDTSTSRAMMVRGIELDKTKQGLKAALQRP